MPRAKPHPERDEERYGIKGWGRYLGELDDPKTLEEAQLTALLCCADRLGEIQIILSDIQARVTRIELWLEETVPNYRPAYTRALSGVKIT